MFELLTTDKVGKIFGISARRIRQLARVRGAGQQVSGIWVFTSEDLEKLKPKATGRPKKIID